MSNIWPDFSLTLSLSASLSHSRSLSLLSLTLSLGLSPANPFPHLSAFFHVQSFFSLFAGQKCFYPILPILGWNKKASDVTLPRKNACVRASARACSSTYTHSHTYLRTHAPCTTRTRHARHLAAFCAGTRLELNNLEAAPAPAPAAAAAAALPRPPNLKRLESDWTNNSKMHDLRRIRKWERGERAAPSLSLHLKNWSHILLDKTGPFCSFCWLRPFVPLCFPAMFHSPLSSPFFSFATD